MKAVHVNQMLEISDCVTACIMNIQNKIWAILKLGNISAQTVN